MAQAGKADLPNRDNARWGDKLGFVGRSSKARMTNKVFDELRIFSSDEHSHKVTCIVKLRTPDYRDAEIDIARR